MLVWIVMLALALGLVTSGFMRLHIPRDIDKEGEDDRESTLAYDRVSRWFLFSLIRYFFIRQLKKYRPQGILMDAGCGPGYLAIAIARQFPHLRVIGVDISGDALGMVSEHADSLKIDPSLSFQEADINQLPLENNSLDFIVSTLSLHHWPDPGLPFREFYRVLKPGGQLLIFDLRRDSPRILFYFIQFGQRFVAPSPIRRTNGGVGSIWSSFTPREIKSLLSVSPFKNWTVRKRWGWVYIWARKP